HISRLWRWKLIFYTEADGLLADRSNPIASANIREVMTHRDRFAFISGFSFVPVMASACLGRLWPFLSCQSHAGKDRSLVSWPNRCAERQTPCSCGWVCPQHQRFRFCGIPV